MSGESGPGLAHYAVSAEGCLGRAHQEPHTGDIDPFEFDLRRVINCSAFRRLQYKTQVFIRPRGDHFRTRMTHTLEVANIARRLARSLRLNVALSEAVALSHDLGHPPFAHAGESALNVRMSGRGGFEHNAQSLRVVDYLEHPFPPFRGLNLSYELRESLAKHRTAYDRPADVQTDDAVLTELLDGGPQSCIEGQVVSVADRIAYDCHDLEDALGAQLIDEAVLEGVALWDEVAGEVKPRYPDRNVFAVWRSMAEHMQLLLTTDVVQATSNRIELESIANPDDARRLPRPVICFSGDMGTRLAELERFLSENVYTHPQIRRMDQLAARMITELFGYYLEHVPDLPPRFAERIEAQGLDRVVCDYLAGMTDRFCEREYKRVFLPFVGD